MNMQLTFNIIRIDIVKKRHMTDLSVFRELIFFINILYANRIHVLVENFIKDVRKIPIFYYRIIRLI